MAEKQTQPLSTIWQRYREMSGFASGHVRTSALAGLAAAWLFTGASGGDLSKLATAPDGLLLAAGLFAASLSADILHYYIGAEIFRRVARAAEDEGKIKDNEVEVRRYVPLVPFIFYNVKVLLLFAGYAALVYKFVEAAT